MTTLGALRKTGRTRLRLVLRGRVQGVGFRPFAHRLAHQLGLAGWVNNSPLGVLIEVEGRRRALEGFLLRLHAEKPPRSSIQGCESTWLDPAGYKGFEIRESETSGTRTALVLPDIATCPDCLRELFDPTNRRHHHPFTNCTNCGPRFSIIEALPYDRMNTSMRGFEMCPECQAEYDNPANRRFHAQPNACPACGPRLELWDARGEAVFGDHEAILAAAQAIRRGQIAAVKGIGGFHLMADARNQAAVQRLRDRKHREEKPFALLFPSLESVKQTCEVSLLEERLLDSPEAPIVLLRRQRAAAVECAGAQRHQSHGYTTLPRPFAIAESVAPGNPNLGVMLPSNPLHHLLLAELRFPVVATSGNLSDEPICTDAWEALERLRGIADVFLVHNRPIVRHVDDSIVRVVLGREMMLRRARGYAPLPVQVRPAECGTRNILAVGAHLKNSIALAVGGQVFTSQHIGDLETEESSNAFHRIIGHFERLYETEPDTIVADLHPGYLSTKFALERGAPARHGKGPAPAPPRILQVQHHIAHVLSCMAENELEPPVLGIAWDGTGYGLDGTIWGGEFFLVTRDHVERVAHLRPFRLPGGDAAIKEPRRTALGLLHELAMDGDTSVLNKRCPVFRAFSRAERVTLEAALARGVNSPRCCSMGRLFDAVASIIGLRQQMRYEGQAAMELEFALEGISIDEHYDLQVITGHTPLILDWSPMILAMLDDVAHGTPVAIVSAKFHNALAEAVVSMARRLGYQRVALSGGCFQNCYLTERTIRQLRQEGFQPYWHRRVPPNDGGIALGQIVAARRAQSVSRNTHQQSRELSCA